MYNYPLELSRLFSVYRAEYNDSPLPEPTVAKSSVVTGKVPELHSCGWRLSGSVLCRPRVDNIADVSACFQWLCHAQETTLCWHLRSVLSLFLDAHWPSWGAVDTYCLELSLNHCLPCWAATIFSFTSVYCKERFFFWLRPRVAFVQLISLILVLHLLYMWACVSIGTHGRSEDNLLNSIFLLPCKSRSPGLALPSEPSHCSSTNFLWTRREHQMF